MKTIEQQIFDEILELEEAIAAGDEATYHMIKYKGLEYFLQLLKSTNKTLNDRDKTIKLDTTAITELNELQAIVDRLNQIQKSHPAAVLADLAVWLFNDAPKMDALLTDLRIHIEKSHEYPDGQQILDAERDAVITGRSPD